MQHTKTILYIDDDIDDRELLSDALKEANPAVEIVLAEDGLKALQYLNEAKHAQLPCLIVLDINMPYLDGKQTAKMIKDDAALRDIPIIAFTSSESPHDKALFHDYG